MPKITLAGPADLLTIIPFHLGFHPERSIVVVCFHGKRLGLMARVDAVPRQHAAVAAAQLMPALLREGPTSVAIVGFEDTLGETMPLSDALAAAVGLEDLALRERLVVRGERWFGLGCDCCPAEGTLLPAVADVPAVATFVGLGRSVLRDRHQLTQLIEPLSPTARRYQLISQAIDAWEARYAWALLLEQGGVALRAVGKHLRSVDEDRWSAFQGADEDDEIDEIDELLGLDERALRHSIRQLATAAGSNDGPMFVADRGQSANLVVDGGRAEPENDDPSPLGYLVDEALVGWGGLLRGEVQGHALEHWLPAIVGPLRDPRLRDAIIAWICPGTMPLGSVDRKLLERVEAFLGDELRLDSPDEPAGGRVPFGGGTGGESMKDVDWEAAMAPAAFEQRIEAACRLTPEDYAAPLLAVYASFAWWAGDGTKAGMAVDRALDIEDDHRLCLIIREALDHGVRSRQPA